MSLTKKRALPLVLVALAACSSTQDPAGPERPPMVSAVLDVRIVNDGAALAAFVETRDTEGNIYRLTAPLTDGYGSFGSYGGPMPENGVPVLWPVRPAEIPTLVVGELVERHGESSSEVARLSEVEAKTAVIVAVEDGGAGPWTVVFHVPPGEGRPLEGGKGPLVLDPQLARRIQIQPPVPAEAQKTGAERFGDGVLDVLSGIGFVLLAVVAIVTIPIWLPILLIHGGPNMNFSCGRPFRRRGRACTARVEDGPAWIGNAAPDASALSTHDRDELSRSWLVEAKAEHASIAAFSALSLDLISVGAPPRLLERAHRAALDEIVHARLCFALASAYAGRDLAPGAFPEVRSARRFSSVEEEIARLAAESLQDGCLIEGFAAAVAVEAGALATDSAVRATLAVIARDEAKHVELAWAIVEWGLERGAERALLAAIARLPEGPSLASAVSDRAALVAHGRLGTERLREVFARTRAVVIERAEALVAATSCPTPGR